MWFHKANANVAELSKRLKHADSANADLQRRVDELTHDLQNSNAENQRMLGELTRQRAQNNDLQGRNDGLVRDNKQFTGISIHTKGYLLIKHLMTNQLIFVSHVRCSP